MKKFLFMAVAAFTLITLSQSCKKKVSDADVAKAATEALVKAGMTGTTVTVEKGVATLTGTCKDDKCKADCEAAVKGIKGIESVVNNCTLAPASLGVTGAIPAAAAAITAVLKDIPTLKVSYAGAKAIFEGTITAKQKLAVAQACAAAKLAPDMTKVTMK